MKVNVRKALATLMATTLIVTSGQCPVASAAKKPVLNSKKVTLKVGQKKTLKVKNKIKGSTYKWKSSKTKVAKVTKKGVVTAVKAGTATITCKVKTKATKKKKSKTYTLKCKVTVKKKTSAKPTAKPTVKPTAKPTDVPSDTPTNVPSDVPTGAPSDVPTNAPSTEPSVSPSVSPSASPSVSPSASPSTVPSGGGGYYRPQRPSTNPTAAPDVEVTNGVATITKGTQVSAALSNSAVKTLKIETEEKENFTLTGTHTEMDVIVNAPKAHVDNEGTFKNIEIQAIGEDTWVEKATGNSIHAKAMKKIHIKLTKNAKPKMLKLDRDTSSSEKPEIQITLDGFDTKPSDVQAIQVVAVISLKIDGTIATGSDAAVKVKVAIDNQSAGVSEKTSFTMESSVKTDIAAETVADMNVTLTGDAKDSKVTVDTAADGGSKVKVTNNTEGEVTLENTNATSADEKKQTISKGDEASTTVVEDADKKVLEQVKAALQVNHILGDNKSATAVTEPLNLYTTVAKYSIIENATDITIEWTSGNPDVVKIEENTTAEKYDVTIQQRAVDTVVTLTAKITKSGKSVETTFDITVPKTTVTPTTPPTTVPTAEPTNTPGTTTTPGAIGTPDPSTAPTDEPTTAPTDEPTATPSADPTASPTVNVSVTSISVTATSGTAVSGTSITVTAAPTVNVTDASGAAVTVSPAPVVSYVLGGQDKPNDSDFKEMSNNFLQLTFTDEKKYLWIKVSITWNGESKAFYFRSEELLNKDFTEGSNSISLPKQPDTAKSTE